MANSKTAKQPTAPMLLSVNQSSDKNKPFYRTMGQGFFDANGIVVHVLPCVVVTGGLLRVVSGAQMPVGLQDRLDIKVASMLGNETVFHIVGTAFKVKDKEGMYSLSLPKDAGLFGTFLLHNPAPKTESSGS